MYEGSCTKGHVRSTSYTFYLVLGLLSRTNLCTISQHYNPQPSCAKCLLCTVYAGVPSSRFCIITRPTLGILEAFPLHHCLPTAAVIGMFYSHHCLQRGVQYTLHIYMYAYLSTPLPTSFFSFHKLAQIRTEEKLKKSVRLIFLLLCDPFGRANILYVCIYPKGVCI